MRRHGEQAELSIVFITLINRVRFEVEHVKFTPSNSLHASIQNVVPNSEAKRMTNLVKCIPTERIRARKQSTSAQLGKGHIYREETSTSVQTSLPVGYVSAPVQNYK